MFLENQNLYDEYDISIHGFIPYQCCQILPKSFQYLENILEILDTQNIPFFRSKVIEIQQYELANISFINNLKTVVNEELNLSEIKFIYSITSMIAHKYSLSDPIIDKIPNIIAIPFYYTAKYLGLPIVMTFSTSMYNWSLIDNTKPFDLYNIKLNYTLFGNKDEAWFNIVTIAVEESSAKIIEISKKIYVNLEMNNSANIKKYIKKINSIICDNTYILETLNKDTCDPDFFFNIMRLVLEGFWDKDKFPNGLFLEGIDHGYIGPKGGSAGQSVTIQIIDMIYGITFENDQQQFIQEIRNYMPKIHKNFIEDFGKLPSLKEYVIKTNDIELIKIFNIGISNIIAYRQYHLKLIYNYIAKFDSNIHGTGGTSPVDFISSMVTCTKKSLLNEKILSRI